MALMPADGFRHPFVQDRERYAELGGEVARVVADYLSQVRSGTLHRPVPDDRRAKLMTVPMPQAGLEADEILRFLRDEIMPWPIAIGHPRSYAWINSPPAPVAVLADQIASAMNTGVDGYDHSSVFLNVALGRWLMELSEFPVEGSFAVLFSGGSAASLNALTAARHHAARQDGWNMREEGLQSGHPPFTLYASQEAHSSVRKCAEQLGIGGRFLRILASDADFRMDPAALREAIGADRRAGLRPMAVVAAAGSTNVGAIDPFAAIADVCEAEDVWFHVDGAYGAFGGLDPEYAQAFRGIGRADTLTVDPHKWLQTPVDCGALLMRHPERHREAFSLTPDYLVGPGDASAPWTYEHMFQLTYANRVLKTWAAIARLGREGVRELVVRCNRLAAMLGRLVEAAPDLELLAPVSLSVVNFRHVPAGGASAEELDVLNRRIAAAMNRSGEVHLETTKVRGRVSLRACILHYENSEADMVHLADLARRCAVECARG
jgi:glutamate/tyrosine decarboxylase-like PLP-dependent enzyme